VQYGLLPEFLFWEACSDSSLTYPTSRTYSNVVTLSQLLPATTYYYKIGSTNSSIEHFFSPREAGSEEPFTVAAVIDMGVYGADGFAIPSGATTRDTIPKIDPELNHTTIWQLAQSVNDYDFVTHNGDFAYADQWAEVPSLVSDPVEAYESILEQFYDQLAPIAGRKAYMVGPGNHDADCTENNFTPNVSCPVGQTNFTDFVNRFGRMMPRPFPSISLDPTARINSEKAVSLASPPFWHSFDYGMVHFITINTETDFANAPDAPVPGGSVNLDSGPFGFANQQLDFIKADLASVDRRITPWVVLNGHRPWVTTGGSGNICSSCQAAFETLMYTYGVDLAIFGHVHNAQRSLPVFNNTADPNGMNDPNAPMYIVAGGAGNIEGLAPVGSNVSFIPFAYADDFSFATVSFLDRNHLRVNFIRSSTGELLDSSVLYKSHREQFVIQTPP
jgi:acid phosphatase type 7